MTYAAPSDFADPPRRARTQEMSTSVQVLSILMFGGFSIAAVAMAFNAFWPAGFALAALIAWRGGFLPNGARGPSAEELVERLRAQTPDAPARASSGNASFDAYRADMLRRLEEEQSRFDGFLERLREAKDKSEFDQFMDDRARRTRLAEPKPAAA